MAEMQAWEKALNIAAKELKMTSIGIQHSSISLLFLNYFNDKSELDYANGLISMPKPDFLGCVGKIPEKIFLDNGWDKKHLFRFGATRFQHYLEHFKDARAWSDKKDRIVVAFCICPKETKELLSIVCQAFAASPQYEVVLKGHYANPFDFYSVQLPKNFRVSNEPLGKLLPEAKIIIVTESSSVFEGLACQSVPVIPLLLESVDLSPLSGISDLPYYANNPRELKSIVDKIISSSESPLVRQKVVEFLNDYCDFLDKDEDYLNRIETVLGRIKMC
jgi:surface carbohydrate biosynthesis protein (TIGR04326 family)